MKARAGLFVDENRLALAVLSGRGTVECVAFDAGENLGPLVAGELDSRGYKRRRLRVGLDRSLAVVKVLELPRAEGSNLGEMVRFELDRHVPFPAEDVAFDWRLNPGRADGPLRVLVGACESRRVEQALRLVREARRRPTTLSIACHDLCGLLPRKIEAKRAVWAHRHDGRTDLVTVVGRNTVNMNTAPAPVLKALGLSDAEVTEITQTRTKTPYTSATATRFVRARVGYSSATFRIEAEGLIAGEPRARIVAIVQRRSVPPRGAATPHLGVVTLSWRLAEP